MIDFEPAIYHDDEHGEELELKRRDLASSAINRVGALTPDTVYLIPDSTDVLGYFMGELDIVFKSKGVGRLNKGDMRKVLEFSRNHAALCAVEADFLGSVAQVAPETDDQSEMWRRGMMEVLLRDFRGSVRKLLARKIAEQDSDIG